METTIKTFNKLLGLFVLIFLVYAVTNIKLQTSDSEATVDKVTRMQKSYVTVNNVDRSLECLAMNIYKEAGNQSFEGKVAIAQVTLNRVDHPSFPKDICSVVYQKNVIMEKMVCQFSWHCLGTGTKKPNDALYRESYAVAKKVLLEGFRLDSLKDAIYFHATYINPRWPHEKITTIGDHIFYRSRI